jgi:hypothetical protein
MRQIEREDNGCITETNFLEAAKKNPDLLWRVVHRYPFNKH